MRIAYNENVSFHLETMLGVTEMLLDEMEIFYYVVELKSFSKAAERLGVSKSFISKKMNQLERDLKVRLISRSTRKLTLTEAGESFYHHCANVVREANRGYSSISELQGKPAGLLKISIPPALGLNLIAPMLPKFLAQYPEVSLDVELENQIVELIKEGYDLALRSAKLASSSLISQRIFIIKNVICATEKYLKSHDVLKVPTDLADHNCATYSYSKDAKHIKLIKNNHEEMVYIQGNFMSNHLDLVKQMVLNDFCIGVLPQFMVANELHDKKLIKCLPAYQLPDNNLYAIYPEREFMLPKLKCFLDMLKTYLDGKN